MTVVQICLEKSVLESQIVPPFKTEMFGCKLSLLSSDFRASERSGLTIGQVDNPYSKALPYHLANGASHSKFRIVRMRGYHKNIERFRDIWEVGVFGMHLRFLP
jgi:hypothetical protein